MNAELPFIGFNEFIAQPLSRTDQRSFSLVRRFFIEQQSSPPHPFTLLMQKLTGKKFSEPEALVCWQHIIKHKVHMQQKLGRTVGIQTAAIDYFEYQSPSEPHYRKSEPGGARKSTGSSTGNNPASGDYRLEKLKEEILRAKRYRHALSIVIIDIDNFHDVNNTLGFEKGDELLGTIVQIIKKIIRNVDFLSRLSGDRFLLILPNTNLREARELAERIRIQIAERTGRLKILTEHMTATLSVCQCIDSDSSITFIRRAEQALTDGRIKKRDTVYSCD